MSNQMETVIETKGLRKLYGKRVGYAPEQECHIPGMIGCEYVTYCGELSGMPFEAARQRAHEMLDFVGMGQERYRKVDTYSTGMKQRIKIAQALVHDPDLIFLDEPTNGLDPKGQEMILELINRIGKESGVSVVLSSHLLHDVERICDRIVIISQGQVIAHDSLEELKRKRRPVAEITLAEGRDRLCAALDERGWPYRTLNNGNISVEHGQDSINGLIQLMAEIPLAPLEARESPHALNELYLQAVDGIYRIAFYLAKYSASPLSLIIVALFIHRLIALDLASQAIVIYNSKALTRWDYLIGKFLIAICILSLVWIIPIVASWLIGNTLSPDIQFFLYTFPSLAKSLLVGFVAVLTFSLFALAVSSLAKRTGSAVAYWILGWISHGDLLQGNEAAR